MYEFCVLRKLSNLWAYLWENWYRRGRWELWARSTDPREIPQLKTTMLVEGQWVNNAVSKQLLLTLHAVCSWRCMKGDYLHHFSVPHVDLPAWVLITKLALMYYWKLEVMLNGIGCFCELPKWRRDFKLEWKKAMRKLITMPLNERYWPDSNWFVCTCPEFVVSQFLICKHLVQLFHLVNPCFFLEVTQNQTLPFWSHPSLQPISISTLEIKVYKKAATIGDEDNKAPGEEYSWVNTAENGMDDFNFDSKDDDDGLIDTQESGDDLEKKTYKEEMEIYIHLIQNFCDSLEFQIKFQDRQFLSTLQKDGARFIQLAQNCLSHERQQNLSWVASPATWERSTANTLFYWAHSCCVMPWSQHLMHVLDTSLLLLL